MEQPQTTAKLVADLQRHLEYHLVKSVEYRNKAIRYQKLSNGCKEIADVLTEELTQMLALQRQAIIPQTAEFKDILGNLVASGKYNSETNEYVTSNGRKVAHWNASLYKIVPVPAVRSKVVSRNKQADPVTHARYLEQQRQRYAEKHPSVERRNPFV
jgi:hypothetical protein